MSPSDAAFEADFFDGRVATKRRVSVARDGATVRIAGDGVALEVPVAALRYQPQVGRLPLRIELPGRAVIVADAAAVGSILAIPEATSLAQRLERHTGMLYASIAGLVVAFVLGWQYGLPWLADRAAHLVPEEVEADIGNQGLKSLDRYVFHPSNLHQDRRDELRKPFEALLQGSGVHATLLFRNGGWIGPNAFALPGGRIVVTDQLVDAMDDDDLVMAVLAHEIGHVAHRHATRQLLQSSLVALGSVLLLGDLSAISGMAATIPTALLHNSYSRDAEREADGFAFDLLVRTGRSPRHFAQALSRLEAAVSTSRKGHSDVPTFLSSHPATKERIRAARDAAP